MGGGGGKFWGKGQVMESANSRIIKYQLDEEAIFEVEHRETLLPSRKPVVLKMKTNSTSKQKLASKSRFKHRPSANN